MSAYELIKDLERKLTLYKDHYPKAPSPPPNHTHELIADLICKAKIYPSLLTREVVISLIEDRQSWPTIDGGDYLLAYPIKVEDLEYVRLITFPHNTLCVQRTVEPAPEMPPQLRHQLDAHNFLYDIRYQSSDLISPHLRVNKNEIRPDAINLPQLDSSLTADHVRLSINDEDIFGVGTFLWKKLRSRFTNASQAFNEYTVRMRLATDRPYVFEIDFDDEIDTDEFLECAFNYVSSDESLQADWHACAADIALSYNRLESLIKEQTNRSTNEFIYNHALNLNPLTLVIDNLTSKPKNTLLEGITWFLEGDRGGYHDRDRISDTLAWLIIKHERNIYSPHNSFPLTKKLITLSRTRPKLINILFSHVSDPPYLCCLLSNRETNHIGLIELYKNIARAPHPISEKVAYEQIWQDLVWTQGLEIYCLSYEEYFEYSHIVEELENICEMVAWFADREISRSARTQVIPDTRIPSIKTAVMSITYLAAAGYRESLFENHIAVVSSIISKRFVEIQKSHDPTPIGEWIVMFWCLEIAQKQSTESGVENLKKLCEVMLTSYLTVLNDRFSGRSNSGDDPLALDELAWSQLYLCASKAQRSRWVFALETYDAHKNPISANNSSCRNSAIRLHFRILLQLLAGASDSKTREDVAEELINIINRFGFAQNKYSGAFNYSNDNSDYSPLRLWPAFCELTNDLTENSFDTLLSILSSSAAPLSALFTLLDKTISQERKYKIEEIIKKRNLEDESPNWIPEIFDIVLKAANSGHIPIAKYFLNSIKDTAHKTHRNKTDELTAKIELKEIFDKPELPNEEKLELIRNFKTDHDSKEVVRSVGEFKSYLIASLNISIDSEASVRQFAQLVKTAPTLQNATGLIKSALSAPLTNESSREFKDHFKTWTMIFKKSQSNSNNSELPDDELSSILKLCLKTAHLDEFSDFWGIATNRQRQGYQFAEERAEFLTRSGRRHEALSYIQKLRSRKGGLPPFALNELANIESNLLTQQFPHQLQLADAQAPAIRSVQADLRNSWLRIRAMNANDQSQILMEPNNSIDTYLLLIIEQVGNELLMRNGNLLRKKADTASSPILLDDEDMINDWLVSLIKQRMNFAGWTVHDQSRMGRSASGKQVGETDGWIQDSNGNLISIIEAFRLGNTIDRTVIKKHLDKVCGYNSTGTSPIFIVVYTSSYDFPKLCAEYEAYVKTLEYEGFEVGRPNKFRRKLMIMPKATAWYYEEIRYVNNTLINIYHQLLNLKPPEEQA